MTALAVYESLPKGVRAEIERRVLARVGADRWGDAPADAADALTLADALGGDDNHPALREELRAWWLERATTNEILARIDAADRRSIELAIVLCAESCAHLTNHSRVTECRRVRLAWVRGEATDEQRAAAMAAARTAASGAAWSARDATRAASRDAARSAAVYTAGAAAGAIARAAVWSVAWAALAVPLRALYSDPCEIALRCGLARWDVAVAEAHKALRSIGGTS